MTLAELIATTEAPDARPYTLAAAGVVVVGTLVAALCLARHAEPVGGAPLPFRPAACYVDPIHGNDQNAGTPEFPFKTLNKAGQWLTLQQIGQERAVVRLEPWP